MTHETRTRAKIGVLVPFTNTNLEADMMLMRCPDTTVHFQRMGGYDVDEIPGSDQMAGLGASDISHDLKMIAGVRPDAVLYGCTSATLTHGPSFDEQLAQDIKAGSGALSFTAAGSLIQAIKSLGVTKVGFSSPYLGEINTQAVDFLAQNQITTVKCADIGRELGNYGQGELTPDEVFDLACQADHPEAEAIVLSCTDMRAVEAVDRIEATLGKPVVTSNQAMMFALMRALGLPRQGNVPGRLFDLL
ncbi:MULTISPECIES: Asp/Glu racemase [unclassified Ruegeria]|uniref:maleate cis-trans isomerase family protein n=1 Tax=unclassified Ruegeria TaxID=2625375 RepID=UPI0014883888|nr:MULTISPECIES: Asp/Glu racemase [unclassified Ruegeria]NOD64628.1 Asp/Glu racemase [Ruegeria sp. HKCCD6109]